LFALYQADTVSLNFFGKALNKNFKTKFEFVI